MLMKKLWTAFVAGCTLMAAQSAWSFDRVDYQGTPSPEPQLVEMTTAQASPSRVVVRAAADEDYTEWVSEGVATMPLYGLQAIENTFNSYRRDGDEEIFFARSSEVYSRALKSDSTAVQYKFANFLGYGDVVFEMDMDSLVSSLPRTELSIPVPTGYREQFGTESISISALVVYAPTTKIFTFQNLFFYLFDYTGYRCDSVQFALPLYSDDEFGEWTSLGEATVEGAALQNIQNSINSYCSAGEDTVTFVYTTEVMTRKLRADESIVQYKFCNLLGYNDISVIIDDATLQGIIERTVTGMPVPTGLKEEVGCKAIEVFATSVSYSPATKIFNIPYFRLYIASTYFFDCKSVEIKLPGANEDAGIKHTVRSGGLKSTDPSITYSMELTGVDHLRYITRHRSISFDELDSLAIGAIDYQTTTDEITVNFTEGFGYYAVLALAMDADDKYLGIYDSWGMRSNLATEGTWESVGRGTWHYEGRPTFEYYDSAADTTITYTFPEDKFTWEVEFEKRTDVDGEVYRVVNPYSSQCGLAESFNEVFRLIYGEDTTRSPFYDDDTYWFEFELKDGRIYTADRLLGISFNSSSWLYSTPQFYGYEYTMKDYRLTIDTPYLTSASFVLDFPGYRGSGIDLISDNGEAVDCSAGSNVAKVVYTLVPATENKPTDAEFAAVAAAILGETDQYEVHTAVGLEWGMGLVELPYDKFITAPSWMVVAAVDADGRPFEHLVAPLTYTIDIENVEMTETLLSFVYDFSIEQNQVLNGKFTGLTLHKSVSPDNVNKEVYTFPNPYVNDPGWFSYFSLQHEAEVDWIFVHDRTEGVDSIYVIECQTGVHIEGLFDGDGPYFIFPRFDRAFKQGDAFYFHHAYSCVKGYSNQFQTNGDNYYVIKLNQSGGDSFTDMIADDNADAPIEYYDLQGRRVDHPAAGGIYIRRQGTAVAKVLVK